MWKVKCSIYTGEQEERLVKLRIELPRGGSLHVGSDVRGAVH